MSPKEDSSECYCRNGATAEYTPGGDFHIKGWGCPLEILKRTPKRYQDPVLWAWHEILSTPERYQIMGFN